MSSKIKDINVRKSILMKYNCRCAYCGEVLTMDTLSIDHMEPLQRHLPIHKRGPDIIDNYNPSCRSCNVSKSNLTIEEWKYMIGFKIENLFNSHAEFRTVIRLGLVKPVKKKFMFYFERIEKNGSEK